MYGYGKLKPPDAQGLFGRHNEYGRSRARYMGELKKIADASRQALYRSGAYSIYTDDVWLTYFSFWRLWRLFGLEVFASGRSVLWCELDGVESFDIGRSLGVGFRFTSLIAG